jgi:coenzyme F420-0:L-glutamate ligase/coenzyme F420-1:gamma-L-glutamate ligase
VITIMPIAGLAEVESGDDVAQMITQALGEAGIELIDGDVVVVTHKIVSKAEGRTVVCLSDADYRRLALDESSEVLRRRGDLIISRTKHGFVCANAGVDRSNVAAGTAVLLPQDPDRSAHRIRLRLERESGAAVGVIISDTFGRAWRVGQVDVAIGVSGVEAVRDLRGSTDTFGRELVATMTATADEIAAAADLVMGKAAGIPAAVVRGAATSGDGRSSDLIRDPAEDLFL